MVAQVRTAPPELGQPVHSVAEVEDSGALDRLQAELQQGRGDGRPGGQRFGGVAFGVGGLGAQEFGVGQHRGGGGGPCPALSAVISRGGEGLAAHRTHPPHAPRSIPSAKGRRCRSTPQALAQFIKANPYGHRDPDGRIGAPVDGACQIEAAIADNDDICYRYFSDP